MGYHPTESVRIAGMKHGSKKLPNAGVKETKRSDPFKGKEKPRYDPREWEGPDYWREPSPIEAWQMWNEHSETL